VFNALRSTQRGEISFGVITFPIWPAKIILAAGLILLTIQLVMDILRLACGLSDARPSEPEEGLYHHAAGAAQPVDHTP